MVEAKRIISLVMGFVENVLFSGACHGWPSLVFVLHEDGIFADLCDLPPDSNISLSTTSTPSRVAFGDDKIMLNDLVGITSNTTMLPEVTTLHNIACPARDRILNLVYTLSVTFMMVGSVGFGKFFDKYGILKLRLFASALFIPGCLLLAFADRERSWMIFPGLILMSVAGACLLVTNYNVTLLAGSKKFTVASLYAGGTDSGIGVFLLIKILWEVGVSRQVSLGVLTGLWVIVLIDSFVLFPKFKVDAEQPSKLRIDAKFPVAAHHDVPTLRESLASPVYITHCVWIALLNLRMVGFFGSFNPWITEITGDDTEKVSKMTNIFGYVQFAGILFNPLVGLAIDWCKKRLYSSTSDMSRNAFAAMPVLFIHGAITVLMSASVLVQRDFFVYISFMFFVVFRSGLFAIYYSYFPLVVPSEHYGIMLGLASACAGLFTLIQFPLFVWAEIAKLGFTAVNILLLAVSVMSLGHPICICIMNRTRSSSKNSADNNDNDMSRAERLLGIKAQPTDTSAC